jgi:hypothetical protein
LTQILAYLRHGGSKQIRDGKKMKKKLKDDESADPGSMAKPNSGFSSLGFVKFLKMTLKIN